MTRDLHPCPACRRHVGDPTCPFCGAAQPARPAHPKSRGRRSRAAVFATLAACGHAPPVTDKATGPAHRKISDPQVADQQIAPPAGLPIDPGTGGLMGVVTGAHGRAVANVTITVTAAGHSHTATTDDKGQYKLPSLPPGPYKLEFAVEEAKFHHDVVIEREKVTFENITNWDVTEVPEVPDFDESNTPKPYGAPPARRRIV